MSFSKDKPYRGSEIFKTWLTTTLDIQVEIYLSNSCVVFDNQYDFVLSRWPIHSFPPHDYGKVSVISCHVVYPIALVPPPLLIQQMKLAKSIISCLIDFTE